MESPIIQSLRELIRFWIDGGPCALQEIPRVCDEIAIASTAQPERLGPGEAKLLRYAFLLASRSRNRLWDSLACQAASNYSEAGATRPAVHIRAWEG
jgi:hypothetical protein